MATNLTYNATSGVNYTGLRPSKLLCFLLLLATFVFGLILNTLYLWVLCFRMKRNVNNTWFFHFIITHLIFIVTMPFLAVFFLLYPHWVFGVFMCKLINFLLSFSMYATVFFLTAISTDRYCLVFQPHFYKKHMNAHRSSVICLLFWGLAFVCSSPYLAFRQVLQNNNISLCNNDYALTGRWDAEPILQAKIKWGMFCFRLLVGFLLPFFIITFCYLNIAFKINKENLTKSNKPYKIIWISIISFFISWTPYHVWYGMSVEKGLFRESTLEALKIFTICSTCFNSCFTPTLYLFIVENFKKVFKKSTLSIFEEVFSKSTEDRSESHSLSVKIKNTHDNTISGDIS
ncbi:probable G-protein coupled receptor 33 [Pseudophryne corroboree]|uniref:probable G-protein coupled receptor 33 n=1 Tax=Pseudophryne corroboree TaxID=495146 RepID=UPI003081C386